MTINVEKKDKYCIIGITGRLDASTSGEFEEQLIKKLDEGEVDIVINFGDLDYISSSGLRVLLVGAKKLKAANKKMVLAGLKKHIYEVFEIAGFTPIFEIVDSIANL